MTWFKSLVMRQNSPLLLIDSKKKSPSVSSFRTPHVTSSVARCNLGAKLEQPKRQIPVRTSELIASVEEWRSQHKEEVARANPRKEEEKREKNNLALPDLRLPQLVQYPCSYHSTREIEVGGKNKQKLSVPSVTIPKSCQVVKDNNHLVKVTSQLYNSSKRSAKLYIAERKRENHLGKSAANTSRKKRSCKMLPIAASQMGSKQIFSLLFAIILYTLTCVYAANPVGQQYFEVEPDAQYLVQNGQDARIRCLIRNRQGECLWLRNGRAIGAIQKKYIFSRQPESGDCSLIIRNVSVQQDDGLWHCQVTASDIEQDTLQSREVQLIVLVAPDRPQIKNTSQHTHRLIVEENKTKTVVCEMRGGNPPPQIEWILDNKNITKEAQSSSSVAPSSGPQTGSGNQLQRVTQSKLRIADIKRTMNGKNLTCIGVHQTLNQSTSVELDVQYVPTVSVVQREYSIVEGSPLSISCQVDSNPPPNIVNWRLVSDGGSISGGGGGGGSKSQQAAALQASALALPTRPGPVLEFERISRDLNQNIFECLAQNSYGISLPADVKLNVLYAPFLLNTSHSESVVVGSEAQLACIFDGNPEPEVKWHYTDPLARSAQAIQLANDRQQYLTIKNVTYRNEGDYHCEARNQINGVFYGVRSSNIILDVYGEPQFLNRSPQQAKALQGSKSELALSFCADPPPNKVYWQFGSLRLDVRLNNGSPAPSSAPKMNQRFLVHPLQSLQKRDSSFSKVATCFEAQLSILDPELTDQRDYTLVVQNERGHQAAVVRLRVSSPLSPVLMITSAFVTICGLFLCSLIVMFLVKKRHRTQRSGSNHQSQSDSDNSRNGRPGGMEKGGVEHLANGNGAAAAMANAAAAAAQLIQHQTRGLVNGTGNGLANGASNPSSMMMQNGQLQKNGKMNGLSCTDEVGGATIAVGKGNNNTHLLSMASSSDSSSSGDQKQLLASSDRQSSVSSTGVGGNFNLDSSPITSVGSGSRRSTAVSTPSPMNHISVDDDSSCTYQAALPDRAQLDAQLGQNSGLIYANLDYSDLSSHHSHHGNVHQNSLTPSPQIIHLQTQQQQQQQQLQNLCHQMPQSSPSQSSLADQSIASVLVSNGQQQSNQQPLDSPQGIRSNVGATIALMNSLAAQAANQKVVSNTAGGGGGGGGGAINGVLNGAINQQLASNRQLNRKAGPPKPPKPSIQQRSRFYTQQQSQQSNGNGLNNNGLVMIGSPAGPKGYLNSMSSTDKEPSANELAVEYSRIAFPARAEL